MTTTDPLRLTVDKFVFTVPTDRAYSPDHCWVLREGGAVKVGLTDFRQQTIGDVACVECRPASTRLAAGDDLASVETIKASVAVPAPVSGIVVAVNESLTQQPELLNEDCYGQGWLTLLSAVEAGDFDQLLGPPAYLALVRKEAEVAEAGW